MNGKIGKSMAAGLMALFGLVFFGPGHEAFAVTVTCKELRGKAVPQKTPEKTYRKELAILRQGLYCYDLPIFDPNWRWRQYGVIESSKNKMTYEVFNRPFKSRSDGRYAVIYYPGDRQRGPTFLYNTKQGWVLDRTRTAEAIRYGAGDEWFALDGDYPYLKLLKEAVELEKGRSGSGAEAYRPK